MSEDLNVNIRITKSSANRLIVIADYLQAKIFCAKGTKIHFLLNELKNKAAGSHEPISRHQGLSNAPVEISPHFYDPRTEIKKVEKECFAREIANKVYELTYKYKFNDCILVAEPVMLGLLRKALGHFNGHISISKALALDIINLNMSELQERIFG